MKNEVGWNTSNETYIEALDREIVDLKEKQPPGWEQDVAEREEEVATLLRMAKVCMRPRPGEEGRPSEEVS